MDRSVSRAFPQAMFQRNEDHRQQGLFDGAGFLSEKLGDRLESSWAATLYHEVFCRDDSTQAGAHYFGGAGGVREAGRASQRGSQTGVGRADLE